MKNKTLVIVVKGIVIIVLFIIIFFCLYRLFFIYEDRKNQKDEYDKIIDISEIKDDKSEEQVNKINFKELSIINPDIVGWLTIEGTNINYPIVQTDNNTYYLKHSFEKKYSNYGAIYMDATADKNFNSLNTFIYGHNTSNGTMFGELKKFMKQSFYDEHKNIFIYTKDKNYKLEVFSVHIDTASSKSYQMNFATMDSYKKYIDLMQDYSVIKTNVDINYETDKIVSLYSCSHERGNSKLDRYFIHGKIQEVGGI